jgi:hypothetical protein
MVYNITPSLEDTLNDIRRGDLDEYGKWVQELISIHQYSGYLGQRFRGSNHIRRPRQACRTKCG